MRGQKQLTPISTEKREIGSSHNLFLGLKFEAIKCYHGVSNYISSTSSYYSNKSYNCSN